jgi:hypothetical protein
VTQPAASGGTGRSFASVDEAAITPGGLQAGGSLYSYPVDDNQFGSAEVIIISGMLSLASGGPLRSGFVVINGELSEGGGPDPGTGTFRATFGSLSAAYTFPIANGLNNPWLAAAWRPSGPANLTPAFRVGAAVPFQRHA